MKPLLPANVLQQKSFKETAFQYMPLMVAAAVIFLFGWVYRKIYPRKTRRPLRTVPAPPPRPGEENETDLEAASSQNTEMLVPQRANICLLSHTDAASDDATGDATVDATDNATDDATVDATDDATNDAT